MILVTSTHQSGSSLAKQWQGGSNSTHSIIKGEDGDDGDDGVVCNGDHHQLTGGSCSCATEGGAPWPHTGTVASGLLGQLQENIAQELA